MITLGVTDYLDVMQTGYESVGGTDALDRESGLLQSFALFGLANSIMPATAGMAFHYFEKVAQIAELPSDIAYLVGALQGINHHKATPVRGRA